MLKVIEKQHDLSFKISDTPHKEWEEIQKIAIKNNVKKAIKDFKDDYFVTIFYKGTPRSTFTIANGGLYPKNVYRVITKAFKNPEAVPEFFSKKVSLYEVQCAANLLSEIEEVQCDLMIVSRETVDGSLSIAFTKIGWEVDEEHVYLVGQNPNKPSSWKHIYYLGDLNCWTGKKMTKDQYNLYFQ